MLQIAYGTCYLHDHGVAHRDLKTCNVVVRQITTPHLQDYLQVKLVDFGLSKVKLSASRSNRISHPNIGTTTYMPPEAFRYGRANWFKADAYSFGVLCSVILSGEEPFQRVPRSKVYEAVCQGERPMLPPETPEELALLIKKCWDTDRNARPDFVEISSKLAKIRHSLLEDHIENYNVRATSYIQQMIRRRTVTRKSKVSFIRSQVLTNVTEENEFFEDQVDVKEQPQELSLEPSHIAAEIPVEILLNRRPFRCQHEGCNRSFKNPQTLKMHSKTHYIGDNAASCKPISPPVLGQSLNSGRNKKIPFRCPKCRKNFVGLDELRRHYGRKHSEGEKPFGCRKCGKKFYMEVDVRDHEKTCGEPMVCNCGLKFAFKCNLVAHKKAHPACQEFYQKHRSPGRNRQTSMLPSSNSSSTSCGSSFSASDSEQSMGSSYPYSNPSAKRQYEEIISPVNSQQLPQFPDFDFPLTYDLSGNFYSGPGASEGLRQDIEEIQKRQRLQLLGETALVLTSDQNPSLPVSTSENILMTSPKDFSQYDFSEITEPVITHPILVRQLQTICSRVEEDLPLQSVKFTGDEEQENSHHQAF
ncbi:hypothetical protein M758_3G210900 [Ceratodon purpureus]|nr:hypothetical protein M758_3G210900 [Ceratodon purpureus]